MTLRVKNILSAGCALVAVLVPAIASAKVEVTPYLEVTQVLDAQLKNGDEVLTYTTASAGVEATIEGPRTQAQLSYRYEHRFGWGQNAGDADVHQALGRVSHQIVRDTLSIEGGVLAAQARGDIRGGAPSFNVTNSNNVSQVYSAYAGPTLSTNAGPLEMKAAYRLGYTKVDANDFTPEPGQPRLDSYDDSIQHLATASVGMAPGRLPFGWEINGAYEREDTGQLDQRYEAKGVGANVTVPVAPTIALLGSVGYEDIRSSQRAPLLDAFGDPVVDAKGRFVTDTASPRLIGYDFDGIYWDVGVGWRPSDRTNLEAHVGRRYGSMSYTGSFTWAPSANSAFQLGVYDEVMTFGQQLNDALSLMPTSFNSGRNPLNNRFGGCVFGSGGGNAGGCLNSALQAVNTSAFRGRGVAAQYSASRGPLSYGLGLGYAQRSYKAPNVPGAAFTVDGVKDETWYGQGNVGYRLDQKSTIDASVYASLYDSGILGAPNVISTGATGAYYRQLGRHLSATAAVGLYSQKIEDQEGNLNASALIGMRYSF
jgi:hypothetical protein